LKYLPFRSTLPVLGLLAAALASCGGSSGTSPEAVDGPAASVDKVILFTVDTLRADQLGVYGNTAYPTPRMDDFAAQSVIFERAYSPASLTVPALSSMLTGLTPRRHGVHGQRGALAKNTVSVQELAQRRGIETASFIANICVLQPEPRTVFHDGWDTAYCGMDDDVEQYHWDQDIVTKAIEWLEGQEGPFLLWVHLMDPHAEHRPNPEDWDYEARPVREKFDQYAAFNAWEMERSFPDEAEKQLMWDLYAAEVKGVDREFGRFMDVVDARDDKDEIAVVFSADHGEELYESWSRYDHGLSLSEGVLWVPMMVRVPGVEPRIEESVVELLQVAPTVLHLLDLPEPYGLDGKSLLEEDPSRGFAFSSWANVTWTIRTDEHRYWYRKDNVPFEREAAQWRADAPWFTEKMVLAEYPAELRTEVEYIDLESAEGAAVSSELRGTMASFIKSLGEVPKPGVVGDAETLKELEKLGYTGYAQDE